MSGVDDLRGDPRLELIEFDLETGAPFPVAGRTFAAVVVTNYLWRPILDDLVAAVAPGRLVAVRDVRARATSASGTRPIPTSCCGPASCWSLPRAHALHVVAYEDVVVDEPRPAVVQRLAARRPR